MNDQIKVRTEGNKTVFYTASGAALRDINAVRYAHLDDAVFTVTKQADGTLMTSCVINGKSVRLSLKDAIEKHRFTVYLVS